MATIIHAVSPVSRVGAASAASCANEVPTDISKTPAIVIQLHVRDKLVIVFLGLCL